MRNKQQKSKVFPNFGKLFLVFTWLNTAHTYVLFLPMKCKGKLRFSVSAARVLPSVPHQERLRGDRAEHLPPQPRVRSHVLGFGGALSAEAEEEEKKKMEEAAQDLSCCRSPMSLCTHAPTDLFIRIERQWTKQTAKRRYPHKLEERGDSAQKDPQIKCLLQVG